jgi:hypothetical protein
VQAKNYFISLGFHQIEVFRITNELSLKTLFKRHVIAYIDVKEHLIKLRSKG